jgi:hypothetical protein
MAFREKSAWIMALGMLLAGAFYFYSVARIWTETGQLPEPTLPLLIAYTVSIVVISVVGHIAIAIFAPKEADTPLDERERQIMIRSSHYSSIVLAIGLITSLGYYLALRDGDLLFYAVFASLMVCWIAEYVLQIVLYRTA